jgi:hypothetical protein
MTEDGKADPASHGVVFQVDNLLFDLQRMR